MIETEPLFAFKELLLESVERLLVSKKRLLETKELLLETKERLLRFPQQLSPCFGRLPSDTEPLFGTKDTISVTTKRIFKATR